MLWARTTRIAGGRSPAERQAAPERSRCGNVPRMRLCLAVLALLVLAAPAAAHPVPGGLPLTVSQVPARTAASTAQAQAQEPPLSAVPRPDCGPGSRRETDIQGRVPAGNPE